MRTIQLTDNQHTLLTKIVGRETRLWSRLAQADDPQAHLIQTRAAELQTLYNLIEAAP